MKRKDHKFEAIPVLLTHCFILMNSNEKYFETEGEKPTNSNHKKDFLESQKERKKLMTTRKFISTNQIVIKKLTEHFS
jgi:hypothetical protein